MKESYGFILLIQYKSRSFGCSENVQREIPTNELYLFHLEFIPHGTYLTREKTEFDSVHPGSGNKTKRETVHRSAYLQLDVLKPGDIFVSFKLTISID